MKKEWLHLDGSEWKKAIALSETGWIVAHVEQRERESDGEGKFIWHLVRLNPWLSVEEDGMPSWVPIVQATRWLVAYTYPNGNREVGFARFWNSKWRIEEKEGWYSDQCQITHYQPCPKLPEEM